MEIHRNNTVIYSLRSEENSTQRIVHMGEDVLNLTFRKTTSLDLRVNDYVYFDNKKYKLKKPVNPRKISRHEFEYGCQFCSPQYDLQDALYVLSDSTGVGELDDTIPLFGTLTFHLDQIIRCVQEVYPEWEAGSVEDFGEGKNIVYSDMDCLQALQHLAEEFGCEYWITGTTINLGKRSEGEPLLFKYGKGNSLYDLSRTNQDGRIITKMLIQGSNRNIDPASYGSSTLRLPGGEKYVDRNTDKYGIIMGRQKFPDIYPRLIHKTEDDPGSVTAARVDDYGICYIKDENLNFNPGDCLLPGLSVKVVFQTGQLGGLKIEANWHAGTHEFELIRGDYGLGMDVPASVFYPAVGDLYLLEDIEMPESYIQDAEAELLEKATEAINQVCEQKVSYKGTLNRLYFKYSGENVWVGRSVLVEDSDLIGDEQIPLRIQALTRNINDPFDMDVEISDTLYIGRIAQIETAIKEIKETIVTTKVKNGDRGAAIVYRGIYEDIPEDDRTFYNNRNRRDVVKYDDVYYIYRGADNAPNTVWIEGNWEKFSDQFESVATGLLLAENANIAGWIFRNERLESQSGGAFLDGRTGEVAIAGKFSSNSAGKKVVIDPDADRKIRLITDGGYEVGSMGFFEETGYSQGRFNLYHKDADGNTVHTISVSPYFMQIFDSSGNGVSISGQGGVANIKLDNLPTSSVGLASGRMYRNGGNLMIVP